MSTSSRSHRGNFAELETSAQGDVGGRSLRKRKQKRTRLYASSSSEIDGGDESGKESAKQVERNNLFKERAGQNTTKRPKRELNRSKKAQVSSEEEYKPTSDEESEPGLDDEEENDIAEELADLTDTKPKRLKKHSHKRRKAGHNCRGVDTITQEDIRNTPHYFWRANKDTNDYLCYSYDTLYKIALRGERFWKEPPIFRLRAQRETLVQLRETFGSNKIDIFHDDHDQDQKLVHEESRIEDTFDNQLSIYRRSQLSSQQIYVCPVCYEYVYEYLSDHYNEEIDPLNVLGMQTYFDEGGEDANKCGLLQAQQMCFLKLNDLTNHLKQSHKLRTSNQLKFRVMLHQYNLRVSDGLIQRYWKKIGNSADAVRLYWNDYDRLEFIFQIYRMLNEPYECPNLDEISQQNIEVAENINSFQKSQDILKDNVESAKIWKELTSHLDEGVDSDKDFIKDDAESLSESRSSEENHVNEESDDSVEETQRIAELYEKRGAQYEDLDCRASEDEETVSVKKKPYKLIRIRRKVVSSSSGEES